MSSVAAFSSANSGNGSEASQLVYSAYNTKVENGSTRVLPFGAYFTRAVPGPAPLGEVDVLAAFDRRGGIVL